MGAIWAKVKSERGATMVMSLFMLLFAVMLSVVTLGAALSAAKGVRSEREQQQAYLTVSSAAQLTCDNILQCEYVKTKIEPERALEEAPAEEKQDFSLILSKAVEDVERYSTPFEKEFIIEADAEKLDKVKAVLRMDTPENGYGLLVRFTLEDGGTHDNCVTLCMQGSKSEEEKGGVNEEGTAYKVTTTTIKWGAPQIVKGEIDEEAD